MKKSKRRTQPTGQSGSIFVEPPAPIVRDFNSNEDWRFEKPVWSTTKCVRCGACCLQCPDSAIFQQSDGSFAANLQLCKGCGLCAQQCITGSITMEAACMRPPWLSKNF